MATIRELVASGEISPDHWLTKADVKHEDIEIVDGTVIWKDGVWIRGWWKGGVWKNGVWRRYGTWEDGIWEGGIWRNGNWEDGIWEDGIWENGNWLGGTWKGGIWKSGHWFRGNWEGGIWAGGKWRDIKNPKPTNEIEMNKEKMKELKVKASDVAAGKHPDVKAKWEKYGELDDAFKDRFGLRYSSGPDKVSFMTGDDEIDTDKLDQAIADLEGGEEDMFSEVESLSLKEIIKKTILNELEDFTPQDVLDFREKADFSHQYSDDYGAYSKGQGSVHDYYRSIKVYLINNNGNGEELIKAGVPKKDVEQGIKDYQKDQAQRAQNRKDQERRRAEYQAYQDRLKNMKVGDTVKIGSNEPPITGVIQSISGDRAEVKHKTGYVRSYQLTDLDTINNESTKPTNETSHEPQIGDKVMISKTVGGGTGVIKDIRGGFAVVDTKGSLKAYHLSDITAYTTNPTMSKKLGKSLFGDFLNSRD